MAKRNMADHVMREGGGVKYKVKGDIELPNLASGTVRTSRVWA